MSTYSHNGTRGRRPYDLSPSPTLVGSRSPSESTISLPRQNNADDPPPPYEADPEHVHKVHDSLAKFSIIFGVFTVIAGVVQLRKSKQARRRAKLQEEHEASMRRERRRRERDRGRWNGYREPSPHRMERVGHGREPLRIEGPRPARSNRGGGSRYGGSDAGRSRR